MHGCGGLVVSTEIPQWGAWFNRHGYAALTIDSYAGRSWGNVCAGGYYGSAAGSSARVADARAALKYLSENRMIDSKRVVLVGFSHGGLTVLMASLDRPTIPYAGFIAFYPYCGGTSFSNGFTVPTMILIGDKDDWTPADGCRAAVKDAKGPITLHVYPGAPHGFARVGGSGFVYGHYVGGDLQATSQAQADIETLLAALGDAGPR
jgi:dienelactone hydrolase